MGYCIVLNLRLNFSFLMYSSKHFEATGGHLGTPGPAFIAGFGILSRMTNPVKLRLHTVINRADFISWCMLYTNAGNKMHP